MRNFRTAFVLILVIGVTALFLVVIWPFLKPLLVAGLVAGLCRPFYQWVTRLLGGRRSLGAGMTLIILFLIVAGPISVFLGLLVKEALSVTDQATPWVREHFGVASTFNAHDWLVRRFPSLADYVPSQEQLVENVGIAAKAAGGFLVANVSRITSGTATFLLNLFVMLYAMFFFLRDGKKIIEKIFYYIPLSDEDEAHLRERLASITRATVKGTFAIGVIQGTLGGFAFWVAGLDGALFWGTIMAIFAILPGIGPMIVWVPAVAYLLLNGQILAGLLLVAWCAAVVGTIDNVLRPILVGGDAKMPDLLILVGTLGGLFLFGPIGFIVGPIVCGLFLTVWEIYGATFKDVLPPVKSPSIDGLKEAEVILVDKNS